MDIAMLVIGIILLVFAVFLIAAVLMQQGKSHNLSGTIAGGAETFFGKTKGQSINKKLSVLTTVVAIVFVVLVCTVYIMQPTTETQGEINSFSDIWEVLFGEGEAEAIVDDEDKADDHDHDGDGKADHDADDHKAEDKKPEDTTKADETTKAPEETTAVADSETAAE